jgi:hypothetical protein
MEGLVEADQADSEQENSGTILLGIRPIQQKRYRGVVQTVVNSWTSDGNLMIRARASIRPRRVLRPRGLSTRLPLTEPPHPVRNP